MKMLSLVAAVSMLAPLPAAAAKTSFKFDGQSYTYSARNAADGARVIRGTRDDGVRYRYVVRGDKVIGWVDGERVNFTTRDAVNAAD